MHIEGFNKADEGTPKEQSILMQAVILLGIVQDSTLPIDPHNECGDKVGITLKDLRRCATMKIQQHFGGNLESIGMKAPDYMAANEALWHGQRKKLDKITRKSERKVKRKPISSQQKDRKRLDLSTEKYQKILNFYLGEKPEGRIVIPAPSQKIYIFGGATGAGKTELIKKMLSQVDAVNIDLDVIRELLMPNYDPTNQKHIALVREESWAISDEIFMEALRRGKSVIIQSSLHRRDRWIEDPGLQFAKNNNIPIHVEMILQTSVECTWRNLHRDRSVILGDLLDSMGGMNVIDDLVQEYPNIAHVNIRDFYQLFKSKYGFLPKTHLEQYQSLMKKAKVKSNIYTIIRERKALEVVNV